MLSIKNNVSKRIFLTDASSYHPTSASGSYDDDECPNPPPMPLTMADAIAALVNATAENARLLRELA